jgi:hypothetical protein
VWGGSRTIGLLSHAAVSERACGGMQPSQERGTTHGKTWCFPTTPPVYKRPCHHLELELGIKRTWDSSKNPFRAPCGKFVIGRWSTGTFLRAVLNHEREGKAAMSVCRWVSTASSLSAKKPCSELAGGWQLRAITNGWFISPGRTAI